MVYLDRGIGEAYVSPQIEASLGFSQEEWLEDPVRWYQHIHPTISNAGAKKLRSCFSRASRCVRHIACGCAMGESFGFNVRPRSFGAKMAVHGSSMELAFDITDLKQTEQGATRRAQCCVGNS